MSNKIIQNNDVSKDKNNKKKIIIGIGIVFAIIAVIIIAYNIVRSVGKSSLLKKDVIQEYDSRYEHLVDINIHQKVSVDEIYDALGEISNTDVIANVSNNRNFDLVYNKKKYKYNNNIINFLLLGIDSLEPMKECGPDKDGVMVNGGQSDAVYIISVDTANKKFWFVQIPRDAVAYIDVYNEDGTINYSIYEQITLQHASGDGLKQSNDRTGIAVSRMLYGLPLHSVTSVNMGGMIAVNDAIGGVTVDSLYTFTTYGNDYGSNETFVQGQTYKLMGVSAYNYVHFRDINRMNTSSERLARQKQYINCFFDQVWDSFTHKPAMILDVYNAAMDYVVTDLNTTEILTLATEAAACTYQGMYELEGEVRAGQKSGEFEHYDIDQEKLKSYLINTYYNEVK